MCLQGFYFGSEAEFDSWCQLINKEVIQSQKTPMFEVNQFRPAHWPPFEPYPPHTQLPMGRYNSNMPSSRFSQAE